MVTIRQLSALDILQLSDQIAVWRGESGDTRRASLNTVLDLTLREIAEINSATFRDPGEIKDIGVNGVVTSGGVFPRSPLDELKDNYSGNNPDFSLIRQAATDLGECNITPIVQGELSYTGTPFITLGGVGRRVMPVNIWSNLFNTAVAIPLFRPTRTNGFGFLTWRYIGDKPLHTTMRGSINMLVRCSGFTSGTDLRTLMRLRSLDGTPTLEDGNGGSRMLAMCDSRWSTSKIFDNSQDMFDLCGDPPANYASLVTGPNLFTGNVAGFFDSGTPGNAQETVDEHGPVGPEVQCTNWMDISGIDKTKHSFLFDYTGTSVRSRVRWQDTDGNFHYSSEMSADRKARRIYRLPTDAVAFQIYYTGRNTTAYMGSPNCRQMTEAASAAYDPVKGYWLEQNFTIDRDVVFWPGTEYFIELSQNVYGEGANIRDWSFRYQGGGMSFLFDAGQIRKQLASKLWKS